MQNEKIVHTMEHGAVWIIYEPDLSQDQKDELRQIVESQDCLLASPYPDLPTPVVASAWASNYGFRAWTTLASGNSSGPTGRALRLPNPVRRVQGLRR